MERFVLAALLPLFFFIGPADAADIRGKDGKCIDIPGGVSEDGTKLDYQTCNGSPEQQWTIKDGVIVGKDDSSASIFLKGIRPTARFSTFGPASTARTSRYGKSASAALSSAWTRCASKLPDGRTEDGTPIQVSECDGSSKQQWKFPTN